MSLNKKNPITVDQTISEYSNIEVTDVEYELYALNTQVNAMVANCLLYTSPSPRD